MDIHYNAFISYRHHPDDIRVATQIHRALERYHIPKAIRKNQKSQLHLFRDKDELPITSNLSDNITLALEKSDYLIVICSTHTKESVWVQREIETFLQTHSYDKVLTVLVDGEPLDTIPDILQYRDDVDSETGERTKIPMEPLSCDWRCGKKIAYREELPRLAAVLLGCSYDELRQRQRQYKMRRLLAILGAATVASLALMGYFLRTSILIRQANQDLQAANEEIRQANIQIQANLDEALWNQSEYLASAAMERYQAGDRLTAISLAMAALPTEDSPRPYVPHAESVLSEALGVYDPYRGITAAGILECGALVEDFAVTEDGLVLYAVDKNGYLTAWDTGTYTKLATAYLGNADYDRMQTIGQNVAVCCVADSGSGIPDLRCYGPDGTLLWSEETCHDFAMLGDDQLMVLYSDWENERNIVLYLDPLTGKQVREQSNIPSNLNFMIGGFYQTEFAPDGLVALDISDWDEDYVYLLDPQTGTVEVIAPFGWLELEDPWIQHVSVTDDGRVLVMVGDNSGNMNGQAAGMTFTSPAYSTVACFGGDSWEMLWQQRVCSFSYSSLKTFAQIPQTDKILCQRDNVFYILDGTTGQILANCQTLSNVIALYVEQDRAYGITADGSGFIYYYDRNECVAYQLLEADLSCAVRIDQAYFALSPNSTHITVYRNLGEGQWTVMDIGTEGYIRDSQLSDDLLITLSSSGEIQLRDVRNDNCLWTETAESAYSTEILGFSADKDSVYVKDRDTVRVMDSTTGEGISLPLVKEVDGQSASTCGYGLYGEDRYCYLLRQEENLFFVDMDLAAGQTAVYPFAQDVEDPNWTLGSNTCVAAIGGGYAWVWCQNDLFEVSLRDGSVRLLLTEMNAYPVCQYHKTHGWLSVAMDNQVLFFRPGGSQTMEIDTQGQRMINLCISGNTVFAINNERQLCRFDLAGNCLSKTELHVYTGFYNDITPVAGDPMEIGWEFTADGDLIVNVFGLGNIIDRRHWEVRGYMLDFVGYEPESNRIICYKEGNMGYFPLYSTEQLMEIAREQLGDYTLSDEMKEYYGIS